MCQNIDAQCQHFLVGASQFMKLINGKMNFFHAHSKYASRKMANIGKISEAFTYAHLKESIISI